MPTPTHAGDAVATDVLLNAVLPAAPGCASRTASWTGVACQSATLAWGGLGCSLAATNASGDYYVASSLYLGGCGIAATIPAALSRLTSLQSLLLGSNQLTGTIPSYLSALSALTYLELEWNDFTGGLDALAGLRSLRELYLYRNPNLRGPLPDAWGTALTALSILYLYNTQAGLPPLGTPAYDPATWQSLPAAWSNLVFMPDFDAHAAGLAGTLPPEWGSPASPQPNPRISLDNNPDLRGTVPAAWSGLSALPVLVWLGATGVCGAIPAGLETMISPSRLPACPSASPPTPPLPPPPLPPPSPPPPRIGDAVATDVLLNALKPVAPGCTAKTATWTGVACQDPAAPWTGVGCGQAGTNASGEYWRVTWVNLMTCGATGTIPDAITRLTSLQELGLNINSFTGTIPPGLSALQAMTALYLDNNNLDGGLDHLGSMPALRSIQAYNNYNMRGRVV
ncbi:hypothetical protein HXX76_016334, partial [Chlamydomonas incerta]